MVKAGLARKADLDSCGPDAQRLRALIEQIRAEHPDVADVGQIEGVQRRRAPEPESSSAEVWDKLWDELKLLDQSWEIKRFARAL